MTNHFDDNIVAFVVGSGAGSKYVHSLLDGHPEIYMIPGYSLMYFYPHYLRFFDYLMIYYFLMH